MKPLAGICEDARLPGSLSAAAGIFFGELQRGERGGQALLCYDCFRIAISEVQTKDGRLYVFVAVDHSVPLA
jgi:hypothetical protein